MSDLTLNDQEMVDWANANIERVTELEAKMSDLSIIQQNKITELRDRIAELEAGIDCIFQSSRVNIPLKEFLEVVKLVRENKDDTHSK